MREKIIKRLRKPLTIDFISKLLRSKGIATYPIDENKLAFRLYDVNWNIHCDGCHLRIYTIYDISADFDMEPILLATNEVTNSRWFIKASIYVPDKEDQQSDSSDAAPVASLKFSFESFCYSQSDFTDLYDFAIYALAESIDYHHKRYAEYKSQKGTKGSAVPIGFCAVNTTGDKPSGAQDSHKRTKIGFV